MSVPTLAQIQERVQKVFREVFDAPALLVTASTTAADIPEWDSIEHINLIIALEEEFGVEFTSAEVTSMSCVGDLYIALQRNL